MLTLRLARAPWARIVLGVMIAVLLLAMASPPSLARTGQTLTQEDIEKLPIGNGDFADIANLVPGADHLGFNEVEQKVLSALSIPTDGAQAYAFGDDPSGTPVLDQPGTHVTHIGATQMQYDSAQFNSFSVWPDNGTTTDGSVYFKSGDGPVVGEPYTLFWAIYDREYPVDDMGGIWTNRGFVTSFPDAPAWESSFSGDTWDGGFRMPTTQYGPNPWSFNSYEYVPPQTFDTPPFDGFGVLTGNTLFLGVRTSDLVAGGYDIADLRFGYHGHDSLDGGPGYVTAWPSVPDRTHDTFVPGFTGFPMMPGTLILEVPEPATTTTISTTTTTTTTIPEEETSPPTSTVITDPVDGTSYLGWWIGGGLLILVGGGVFFVAHWNNSCIPLKGRWIRAMKACEEARRRLEERRASLQEAKQGLQDAEDQMREQDAKADAQREQLERLERARRSSMESGGTTFHRIPEGLVTADGLESIIESIRQQVESHEEAMESWREAVEGWQDTVRDHERHVTEAEAEAKAKCDAAEAAKKAYEDCINAAASDAEAGGGESSGSGPGGETGTGSTGGGDAPPPEEPGTGGSTGGESGPGVATGGGGTPESEAEPECEDGETKEEELESKSFVVPATTGSLVISIEPPTEEFADWMAGQMQTAGGWFSPSHLNDPGLAGTIRGTLGGLDSGMAVSHSVRIEIPRQEITYACIQHWECRGGTWVRTHKERREVGRRDRTPIVIEESGKIDSVGVARLIAQAQQQYQRLVRTDESISQFCQ